MRPRGPLGYRGWLELLELLALDGLFFALAVAVALDEEPDNGTHQQHHHNGNDDGLEEDLGQAHRGDYELV